MPIITIHHLQMYCGISIAFYLIIDIEQYHFLNEIFFKDHLFAIQEDSRLIISLPKE